MMEYRSVAEGRGGIWAKVVADSVSTPGRRITTFELHYPRFIHSELMTHRQLSRNAASSRAIPVAKMIENIKAQTAMPIHWGKNQPGMQANEECDTEVEWCSELDGGDSGSREEAWGVARDNAIEMATAFNEAGYHKQIVNRLLEPYQFMKTIVTATEYDNLFFLRRHKDAQPEFKELADCMWRAYQDSKPIELISGEWHVPYYRDGYWKSEEHGFSDLDQYAFTIEQALAVSSSCCAQVSYRRLDDSLEKAQDIFQRLITSKPAHASPMEHQAAPMPYGVALSSKGVTSVDKQGRYWSGNFCGWIQHRQLLDDHTCWEYKE